MDSRVAFLALTYDDFQHEEVMRKFFSKEASFLYNLYIHNKNPLLSDYFSPFCLKRESLVDTEWGSYSLVRATVQLLKCALADSSNQSFVLISDSHCPLYSMNQMCDLIYSDFSKLSFSDPFQDDNPATKRFLQCLDQRRIISCPISPQYAKRVSQFFICNRAEAEIIITYEAKLRKWFNTNNHCVHDETYFHALAKYLNLDFQIKNITHCNFKLPSYHGFQELGIRDFPKTYLKINKKLINCLRNKNYLFVRKIHSFTEIDIDHLLYAS